MSEPNFNRGQSNVTDWLDGKYEYVSPDNEDDKGTKSYPHIRFDPVQNTTPTPSDAGSARGKDRAEPREDKDRLSARRTDRPCTPSSDDEAELSGDKDHHRERDHDRHRSGRRSRATSGTRTHDSDREDRHDRRSPREHKEARYPPRADRGRPQRPPIKSAKTTPSLREDKTRRHRHYSQSSSPPRDREDQSSRHHHHHHHHHHHRRRRDDDDDGDKSARHNDRKNEEDDRSTRHRDRKDDDDDDDDRSTRHRDRDARTQYSGSSRVSAHSAPTKGRSSNRTSAEAAAATPKSRRSSFAFLSDPRFTTAAQAALTAGVTAAVGAVGKPNAGVKVAQAALGAAALGALKGPAPEPAMIKEEKERDRDLGRRASKRRRGAVRTRED